MTNEETINNLLDINIQKQREIDYLNKKVAGLQKQVEFLCNGGKKTLDEELIGSTIRLVSVRDNGYYATDGHVKRYGKTIREALNNMLDAVDAIIDKKEKYSGPSEDSIYERIQSEFKKHGTSGIDWARLAAMKIKGYYADRL